MLDVTAVVTITFAVALSIIGFVAITVVPAWAAFSEHRTVYRWTVLVRDDRLVLSLSFHSDINYRGYGGRDPCS